MTTTIDRNHESRSYFEKLPEGVGRPRSRKERAWEKNASIRRETRDNALALEPYTREDMWLDELEQLPEEERIHRLVELLRSKELRQFTEGFIIDFTSAVKSRDCLEAAKGINSWIATAEEIISSRRKMRYILAARDRTKPQEKSAK